MYDVVWYKINYKEKIGWVSEYDTNRAPQGVGKEFCPRNPKGVFATIVNLSFISAFNVFVFNKSSDYFNGIFSS